MRLEVVRASFIAAILAVLATSGLGQNTAIEYYNRGIDRQKAGNLDGAVADFNKAIELKPDFAAAYDNRGNAKADKGDIDGAIADYDQAIRLEPGKVKAYYNRGTLKHRKGDLDGAIVDLTRAIDLNPKYGAAYNNRAYTYFKLHRLDAAIKDAQEAVEIEPNDADNNDTLGDIYFEQKAFDLALKAYEKSNQLKSTKKAQEKIEKCKRLILFTRLEKGPNRVAIKSLKKTYIRVVVDNAAAKPAYEGWISPLDGAIEFGGQHIDVTVLDRDAIQITKDGKPVTIGDSDVVVDSVDGAAAEPPALTPEQLVQYLLKYGDDATENEGMDDPLLSLPIINGKKIVKGDSTDVGELGPNKQINADIIFDASRRPVCLLISDETRDFRKASVTCFKYRLALDGRLERALMAKGKLDANGVGVPGTAVNTVLDPKDAGVAAKAKAVLDYWCGKAAKLLAKKSGNSAAPTMTAAPAVSPPSAENEYALAEKAFSQKDYSAALPLFHRASTTAKEPAKALGAHYFEARCLEALDKKDEAGDIYQQVAEAKNPNSYREDARESAARIALSRGRKADALKQYEALANETQDPSLKAEATARAGKIAAELKTQREKQSKEGP